MTRLRSSGFPPQADTELTLARDFWLPTARTFSLTGQARVSALASDATVDREVGRTTPGVAALVASSSSRLTGDVAVTASAAVDGTPGTLWESGFGITQAGQWLQYSLPTPITFDALDMRIVADAQHSVPTAVTVTAGGTSETVSLPPIADGRVAGSEVSVPLTLTRPLTGQTIRVTFDGVANREHAELLHAVSVVPAPGYRPGGHRRTVGAGDAGHHPLALPRRPPRGRRLSDLGLGRAGRRPRRWLAIRFR